MGHPILYEINARCWLQALAEREGRGVTLADVPEAEFARWQHLGFTHVWLMGVWTTGPLSRAQALNDPHLRKVFNEVLPGWREEDVAGSPYAISNYQVPPALGGEAGLKAFRAQLNARGLKLLLDFVPNHLGLDHPWAGQRPELFVQSPIERPGTFLQKSASGPRWLAHGKDPYFAPWTDTIQLDYRRPETRAALIDLLQSIARRCDGVRCDMAMLMLNEVFAKTWDLFPTSAVPPSSEFWADAISSVKESNPGFLFLAEAYWGMQPRLQTLGFDFTYDKHITDCLIAHRYGELQQHLLEAAPEYLARSAHFLENHDELRIASVLSQDEHRAAALMMLGLPGMRLLYDGELTGARLRTPVQLTRCPKEPVDKMVLELYDRLLAVIKGSAVGNGEGKVLRPEPAWEGNPTAQNFVVTQWARSTEQFDLMVVNLASHRGQCRVQLSVPAPAEHDWEMRDLLSNELFQRSGSALSSHGLNLDLPENGAQLFRFTIKH
ncbi:MAG: Alpha amylase, catalytic subdomain [Pedosphaera sp.]|nr:Alpha amylase, catalytic subdomain [Pedosphaera sp.]